ncbi:MAG TPA: DNA repair protein RadC, partial [Alistipes sp.]|nr:DNA repair protein RadC [Alistipes sp.]
MTEIADKMAVRGVESLTDRELLTALVEDGRLAGALLDAYGGSLARMADEAEAR